MAHEIRYAEPLGVLLDAAADEIERLTLTPEEREAVAWLTDGESPFCDESHRMVALRGLLERHRETG